MLKAQNPTQIERQLTARRVQLAATRKQIRSGAYSEDDVKVLKGKEAFLLRVIANLKAKA